MFSRESKGSLTLQKKMLEARHGTEAVPDLTDFMNDMFFGTAHMDKKNYDLTGGEDYHDGFDDSTRSNSSKLIQKWLEEARRIVSASPARCDFPGRLARFAAPQGSSPVPSSDRRDPLSRSARRNRSVDGFTGEILSKSVKLSRNKSDTFIPPSPSHPHSSPPTPLHKLFSVSNSPPSSSQHPLPDPIYSTLPPRYSLQRKSRFQTQTSAPHPQANQPHSRRTFRSLTPSPDAQSLPSPENVTQPTNRRSLSKSNSLPLSPPRNLVESAHRRSISSSTCSLDKLASRPEANGWSKHEEGTQNHSLNGFLKEQRILMRKILKRELNTKAKMVLSGPSNSTTAMVAAICYAWLLGYRQRESDDGREDVVVPVMNVKRGTMWKLRQAAWLFYHAGLDVSSLLFADEVDMESLMMTGQLSIIVVGKDILSTTGEVGSQCTIVTDNYCEDAYDLLQNPVLKKLLLAGILLDTQNLEESGLFYTTRDSEAVQLLLVGSAPNYRYAVFDQLMQDQNGTSFVEALHHNYGNHPDENDPNGEGNTQHIIRERKSTSTSDHEAITQSPNKNSNDTQNTESDKVSPKSAKLTSPSSQAPTPAPAHAEREPSRGKTKFSLARWFGFGPK